MNNHSFRRILSSFVSVTLLLSVTTRTATTTTTAFQTPIPPQQQTPRQSIPRMHGQRSGITAAAPPSPIPKERVGIASSSWPTLGVPNHAFLTKRQEQTLGKAIQKSRKLRQWLEQQPSSDDDDDDYVDDDVDADDDTSHGTKRTPLLDEAAVVYSSLAVPYQNYTQAQIDTILEKGNRAKQTLMLHNIKLVSGIAKKWAFMTHNNKGEYTSNPYAGSLTRPSLQEAIQEGIVGLAKAAERFEPNRNWRFSTYATYWITNSIRLCYTQASTGQGMRLPNTYYETLGTYKALVKRQYQLNQCAPPMEELAAEMNIRVSRLQRILQLTQPPLSLETPTRAYATAGKSGLADKSDSVLGDLLCMDAEDDPEVLVEWSLLRRALDHAMVTQLSPHERNVIRLRLGLDDGVTRTSRQVANDFYEGRFRTTEIVATWNRALKKLRSPRALSQYQWMSYFELCDIDIETVSWR